MGLSLEWRAPSSVAYSSSQKSLFAFVLCWLHGGIRRHFRAFHWQLNQMMEEAPVLSVNSSVVGNSCDGLQGRPAVEVWKVDPQRIIFRKNSFWYPENRSGRGSCRHQWGERTVGSPRAAFWAPWTAVLSEAFVTAPGVVGSSLNLGVIIHPWGHSDSDVLLLISKVETVLPAQDGASRGYRVAPLEHAEGQGLCTCLTLATGDTEGAAHLRACQAIGDLITCR